MLNFFIYKTFSFVHTTSAYVHNITLVRQYMNSVRFVSNGDFCPTDDLFAGVSGYAAASAALYNNVKIVRNYLFCPVWRYVFYNLKTMSFDLILIIINIFVYTLQRLRCRRRIITTIIRIIVFICEYIQSFKYYIELRDYSLNTVQIVISYSHFSARLISMVYVLLKNFNITIAPRYTFMSNYKV